MFALYLYICQQEKYNFQQQKQCYQFDDPDNNIKFLLEFLLFIHANVLDLTNAGRPKFISHFPQINYYLYLMDCNATTKKCYSFVKPFFSCSTSKKQQQSFHLSESFGFCGNSSILEWSNGMLRIIYNEYKFGTHII